MHRLIAILGAAVLVILLGAPSRFPTSQSVKLLCHSGVNASAGADTTEDVLATCTVPANSMGKNGQIHAVADFTTAGAGGNKIPRLRWGGAGGTLMEGISTNSLGMHLEGTVANKNATNSQIASGFRITFSSTGAGADAAPVAAAVDTTASTTVVVTCQKVSASDTCTLNDYSVTLISDGT